MTDPKSGNFTRPKKIALLLSGAGIGIALSLSFSALADRGAPSGLPTAEVRALSRVFGLIKENYVEPVDDRKLIDQAIKGMVSGLDPHSSYLDAKDFQDLQENTQGEFGGLGLEVGMEDGLVRVTSPIEDTPAYRAGIKAGDLIVKIDDTPVQGIELNDAVSKMRGKPGTSVTLTILRKGESKPLVVKLTRAVIKVLSVKSRMLEPGFGYVRVTQFQEHTTDLLAKALTNLYKENKAPLKGLVLDLRNDPGGLLDGAVGVSAAFLPKDALVVYTEGRTRDSQMRLFANPRDYIRREGRDPLAGLPKELKSVPLVVLVNNGSASASEIVAGALQDHRRAIVVGTQTFGKGSVQSIVPVDENTAVKLTTARYFTPQGRSIQAKGITPDIVVEEATLSKDGNENALRIREADLDRHLDNPQGEGAPAKPARPAPPVVASSPAEAAATEAAAKGDYQLQQAISVLKVQLLVQNKPAPGK